MSVAVVKLGVGNTASVMFALERLGAPAVLTDDAACIADAERIVLPGVGAAAHAMRLLAEKGLRDVVRAFQRPFLGLCLGQQLLYEASEEGDAPGLGVCPGTVARLAPTPQAPAPHMGWSRLRVTRSSPLVQGVDDGAYVYFVHSYVCPMGTETIASAAYGTEFSAIVGRGNFYGCQFHPERSGAVGARILANFLSLPC
jgi:glutamine amidotransferase